MRHTQPSLSRQILSMLTTWLLIITVLPLFPAGSALAFMPTNASVSPSLASAVGSATHESITVDVIKDYDKNLFQLGNKDLTENMKKAQNEIVDANTDVDNLLGHSNC